MQNSELYRRGIVLPLDDNAEHGLRCNDVEPTISVRHLAVTTDSLFERLWSIGLFQEINQRCGTMLDDYEEGIVEAPSVSAVGVAVRVDASNSSRIIAEVLIEPTVQV